MVAPLVFRETLALRARTVERIAIRHFLPILLLPLLIGRAVRAEELAEATPISNPSLLLDNRIKTDAASPGAPGTGSIPALQKNPEDERPETPPTLTPPPTLTVPPVADDPKVDENGRPVNSLPNAPRIARVSDYVQSAPIDSRPLNKSNPVTENYASPVANELVRDASNENIFQQGSNPVLFNGQPGGEAPVLRSGPWAFHPAVSVENFLNDNFFGSVQNRRDSWLRNESAAFSTLYTPNKNVSLSAYYNFTMHDYSTTVVRDYYDENAGLALRLNHFGAEGLSFNLGEAYNQFGNTVLSPLADQFDLNSLEIRTGQRYSTNAVPVSLQYEAGPWSLEAGYEYDSTEYFSRKNSDLDAQQEIAKLRAAYAIIDKQLNFFTEYYFNYTRYPSDAVKDYDFQRIAAGVAGTFGRLTYRARAGWHIENELQTNSTYAQPALSADVNYVFSPRVEVSAFVNRQLDVGLVTGRTLTDSLGGIVNIHAMKRGTLTLAAVDQKTERVGGADRLKSADLGYKHTILRRLEPRLGVKYSEQSTASSAFDILITGYAGMGVKIGPRSSANLDYYHENRALAVNATRVTDRLTAAYNYRINLLSKINVGYDRVERRDSRFAGTVKIDELRIGVNLSW